MSAGEEETQANELVIIRRNTNGEEAPHKGGVWKIAYADFMTAMMAFFLVMWLINATDKQTLTQVATYFNPMRLTDKVPWPGDCISRSWVPPPASRRPAAPSHKPDRPRPTARGRRRARAASPRRARRCCSAILTRRFPSSPPRAKPSNAAPKLPCSVAARPIAIPSSQRSAAGPGETNRRRTTARPPTRRSTNPRSTNRRSTRPKPTSLGRTSRRAINPQTAMAQPQPTAPSTEPGAASPPAMTPLAGPPSKEGEAQARKAEEAAAQQAAAAQIEAQIKEALARSVSGALPGIDVKATDEGVLISLTDQYDFGMFAIASAEPRPAMVVVMDKLAKVLAGQPERLIVSGHTDGRPYKSGTYDNWRLSSARAHMAYYMLVRGGIDEKRVRARRRPRRSQPQDPRRPRGGAEPAHRDPPAQGQAVSPMLRLAAPLMALVAVLASAHGQEAGRQPADLVRSLQTLQDEIAQGSAGTHLSQRVRLAQIAEQLALAKPEVWKEPRNARAAIAFVLSGGDPRILKKLSEGGMLSAIDAKLVQGVVAYGEGRSAEAADLLVQIAARSLEPSIAGHLALVQAELTAGKEPSKALAFFDEARLLSPGTLIEEAALRRQISLVAAAKDFDRFDMLAANYLRRFARSVYAASFRQQFAADVAARDAGSAGRMAKLVGALEAVDAPDRRDIYLLIAREALIRGKFELARLAGDKRRASRRGGEPGVAAGAPLRGGGVRGRRRYGDRHVHARGDGQSRARRGGRRAARGRKVGGGGGAAAAGGVPGFRRRPSSSGPSKPPAGAWRMSTN